MKRIREGDILIYSGSQDWDNGQWESPVPRQSPYNKRDSYGARYYMIPSDALLEGL